MSPATDYQQQLRRLEWQSRLLRLLSMLAHCALLLFCVFVALPLIKANVSHPWVKLLWNFDHGFAASVKSRVQTEFYGVDMFRWAFIVVFYFVGQQANRMLDAKISAIFALRYKASYEEWKTQHNIANDSSLSQSIEQSLAQSKLSENASCEELLDLFAETKRRLEAIGRDFAFLAIDVVDSTGMKAGEEQGVVMHAFAEYRRYVEGHFSRHGLVRATWTPDGVMACFPTVQSAVSTAMDIIEGLPKFNKDVQMMKRDFEVRCGVNAGFVYYDPSQPLEHLSDRVLDITGHLQKKARPNTVCVARPAIEPLSERHGFVPAEHTVSGYEVFEWRPSFAPLTSTETIILPTQSFTQVEPQQTSQA